MKENEFEAILSLIREKNGKNPLKHISEYGDGVSKRIFAIPNKLEYKQGDTVLVNVMLLVDGSIASCDYFIYTVTSDWGYVETKQIAGNSGTFSLSVECGGMGELGVRVIACDAEGNPIEGIEGFNDSVVIEPPTFEGLWAEELSGNETIAVGGSVYKMTFFDDFDGKELDIRKWSLCPEQNRQNAGGYWRDSMTALDGKDNLILTAAIDEKGTPISGGIRSLGKFEQARGYFEVRCKLQNAPGFWAAFWLMCREMGFGSDSSAVSGAEIDIFESNSVPDGDINHAIHWGGYGNGHKSTSISKEGTNCYDGEFHTFALLWDENGYIFYIDGRESWRSTVGSPEYPGSCEIPCYLKLTVEFGTWAGKIDPQALPDQVVIDYVKVYEKAD